MKDTLQKPDSPTVQYHLYIDECGDQNLENFSPTFPIFTLCGILVRDDKVALLEKQIKELKQEFWGDRKIILHSRDIRKCQNGFEILFDLAVKQRFYQTINTLLNQNNMYVIVYCSILKEPYIRLFGKLNEFTGSRCRLFSRGQYFASTINAQMETDGLPPLWRGEASARIKNFKTIIGNCWKQEHIG